MPFRSGKRPSGQALQGATGQSNSARVSRAGRRARAGGFKRGSESHEVPPVNIAFLSGAVVSAILTTSATVTFGTNTTDGTTYWIADENSLSPSVAQIKAGLEQAGGAADDSGNDDAANPFAAGLTGLTLDTEYFFWAYQENSAGDSNIIGVSFTTAAA